MSIIVRIQNTDTREKAIISVRNYAKTAPDDAYSMQEVGPGDAVDVCVSFDTAITIEEVSNG